MSSDEFREELATLGLPTDGTHNELLRRVKQARMQGGEGAASGKRAATEREDGASEAGEAARPAASAAEKTGLQGGLVLLAHAAGMREAARPSAVEQGGQQAGGVPMRKKQKPSADGLLDRGAGGGAGSGEEVGRQILSVCSLCLSHTHSLTHTPHSLSLSL